MTKFPRFSIENQTFRSNWLKIRRLWASINFLLLLLIFQDISFAFNRTENTFTCASKPHMHTPLTGTWTTKVNDWIQINIHYMNFIDHNENRKQTRKINSSPCFLLCRTLLPFNFNIVCLCARCSQIYQYHYFVFVFASTEIVWSVCRSVIVRWKYSFFSFFLSMFVCNSEWTNKMKTISTLSSNRDHFKWKMWWHFEKQKIEIIAIVIIKHVVCCRDLTDIFQWHKEEEKCRHIFPML